MLLSISGAEAATYSQTVLNTSGLAGYWRLNETSGTATATSFGSVGGAYSGSYTLGQGRSTPADASTSVRFLESSTGVFTLPNNAFQTATWSWEFWVNFANRGNTSQEHAIIHRDPSSASGSRQFWIGLNDGGQTFEAMYNYNSSSSLGRLTSTVTPALNTWYHVVVTVQPNSAARIYVNGSLNAQISTAGQTPVTVNDTLRVGALRTGGTMDIRLDEVAFYTTALSAATVTSHWNAAQDQGSRLSFTAAPTSVAAGSCSGAFTIRRETSAGAAANAPSAETVTLATSAGTGRFYSNSTCTTQINPANFTMAAGTSTVTAYYQDSAMGSRTISVTNNAGLTNPANRSLNVTVGPPTVITYTTGPQTRGAGICSGIVTVQLQDGNGNASNAGSTGTLNLSSSGGTLFFSDAGCAAPITSVSVASGTNNPSFYVRRNTPGTDAITAALSGFSSVNQNFTVTVNAASTMGFTTAPQTLAAGVCSGAVTIQSRDNLGNVSPVATTRTVNLSSNSTGNTFYSDAACTAVITTRPINAGASTATFYFRDNRAGSSTVTVQEASLGTTNQVQTINVNPATVVAFTSGPQTLAAGACSAAVTLQTRDNVGNVSNVAATRTINLSSNSTGNTFYSDAACTSAVTTTQVANGTSTATFYFRDNRSGSPTVTVQEGTLGTATQGQTINPISATVVAFTSGPQTLAAGACSAAVTVQSRDSFGNTSNVSTTRTLNLSSNSTGNTFYSDAACTAAITTRTITSGTSTATFYFRDNRSGSPTVTVQEGTLGTATQGQTINVNAASAMAFTTGPQTLTANACSGAVTVQTRDNLGNVSPVSGSRTLNLSSNSTGNTFYSDAACTAAITTHTMTAGQSTATFYFRDTRSGSPTVSVQEGTLGTATQVQTINAGAPTQMAFSTPARSAGAALCSAVLTVELRDAQGNVATATGAGTLNLTALSGTQFFSDAGCASIVTSRPFTVGATNASFYARRSNAGGDTLTAAMAGFTSITQGFTVTANAASTMAFTTTGQTRSAGACSGALTVQTRDNQGNASPVVGARTLNLSSNSTGNAFYSDAACTAVITTSAVAAGTSSTTFYFRDTRSGSPTLTVQEGTLGTITQGQTITVNAASAMAFTTTVQTLTAGTCSGAVSFETRDNFGNVSPVAATRTVNLSSTSTGNTFYSDAACTTVVTTRPVNVGTSTATFYFRDIRSGSPTVTLQEGTLGTATQTETINPNTATAVAFTSSTQTLAAGGCSAAVTVQTRDTHGNPSNVAVTRTLNLSSNSTGNTFYSDAACTAAITTRAVTAGSNAATFYFRDSRSGSPTLTAQEGTLGTATQGQTINPNGASAMIFTTTGQTLTANACSGAVSIQTRDNLGNNSNVAATRTLNLSSNSTGNTFYSDAGCTAVITTRAVTAGTSTATFYFRDTRSGSPTLTVQEGTLGTITQGQTINAGPPSAMLFTTPARSSGAGICSAVLTVELRDAQGNVATAAGASTLNLSAASGALFFSDAACATGVTNRPVTTGATSVSFYARRNNSGSDTLTAAMSGFTSITQAFTVTANAASRVAFTSAPHTLVAGTCSGAVNLQTRDNLNNPSPVSATRTLALSSNSTGNTFYSDAGCTAVITTRQVAAGSSTATVYFRDTRSGAPTLTVQEGTLGTATQVQTINAGAANSLVYSTTARTVGAGACSAVITVQLRDTNNNVATAGSAGTVQLTAASGTQFFSDAACSAAVSSVPFASGASAASFYAQRASSGTDSLTSELSGFAPVAQTFTITTNAAAQLAFSSPPRTITAGVCSEVIELQTQDAFGNVSAVAAPTTVTLSANVPSAVLFSNSDCSTATTTVNINAGQTSAAFYFLDTRAGTTELTVQATTLGTRLQNQTVQAAAATSLRVAPAASTVDAGTPLLVTVTARDDYDNVVPGFTGNFTFTASDLKARLPNPTPMTGSGLTLPVQFYTAGVQTVEASTSGPPALSATSTPITVLTTVGAPRIVLDASLRAGVGQPYLYNPLGTVTVTGERPMSFSACGGPSGFSVDATSGLVSWRPASVGTVRVCVAASNARGSDQYAYDVNVSAIGSAAAPLAVSAVTPQTGIAPLDVQLDASASTVDAASLPALYLWTPGASALPVSGVTATASFLAPGAYPVDLTVVDGRGLRGTTRRWVQVQTTTGQTPPTADIQASALRGEGSLAVTFSCDCAAGTTPIASHRWTWATGSSNEASHTTTFGPGRHRVHLTVIDRNGLAAHDAVEIVVTQAGREPPSCRAYASVASGPAPLTTTVRAVYGQPAGSIASHTWTDWSGAESSALTWDRTLEAAGRQFIRLRVVDDAGLVCNDAVLLQATDSNGLFPIEADEEAPVEPETEVTATASHFRLGCSAVGSGNLFVGILAALWLTTRRRAARNRS